MGDSDLIAFEVNETSTSPSSGVCVKLKPFREGSLGWLPLLELPAAANLM